MIPRAVRLGVGQNLASTTTSSASSAFGATTYMIRVTATAAVNVRIDSGTPTAVTTDTLINANQAPEYFIVSPGQKLAAIGTGTVNVTECS